MKKLCFFLTLIALLSTVVGCTDEVWQPVVQEIPEEPEQELPSAYSYMEEGRMPILRNQGDTNTCWAFAALSALECSMDEDAVGPYSADHLIFHNPFGNSFVTGGSYVVTMGYLLSWEGPVGELEDPFDGESPEFLEETAHVQEIRQSQPKDYQRIKEFVYHYGGVETALYVDFQGSLSESPYYQKEFNSYCYQGTQPSNHDVVIIGWDDAYPAENFAGEVQEDGAFLCLNSWGEEFGNAGTFYVSYEDVHIGEYGITYSRIDNVGNYDRIFQSDLCGFTAQIGYGQEGAWFANAYTAEEDVTVRAAGFYATGENTEYEIYAVPKFLDERSFLEKYLVAKGKLKDEGFYTIDLQKPLAVDEGENFALAVRIITENAEYPVAVECQVPGLSENADISDGRGYLSLQGNLWEHVEETKEYNICLKAYADLR